MYPFQMPTTMLINGPTGSGKTTWLYDLLKSKNFTHPEQLGDIYYYYGVWQT